MSAISALNIAVHSRSSQADGVVFALMPMCTVRTEGFCCFVCFVLSVEMEFRVVLLF